jgi:fibronectin-binding autotransporter adhesin
MVLALLTLTSQADVIYWDGVNNAGWDNVANWSTAPDAATPNPAAIPGASDDIVFSISASLIQTTVNLNGNRAVNSITLISSLEGTQSLGGGGGGIHDRTLTIGPGGITALAGQGFNIGSATGGQEVHVLLNGSQEWLFATPNQSRSFTVRNTLKRVDGDTEDRTLLLNHAGAIGTGSINPGVVSDGGSSGTLSLWKSGKANLSLQASTYTGGTTLQAGNMKLVFNLAAENILSASAPLTLRGGTLTLDGSDSVNNIQTVSGTTMAGGVTSLAPIPGSGGSATLNLGAISRAAGGGAIHMSAALDASRIVQTGNANVNELLGPWATTYFSTTQARYVTVSGGNLTTYDPAPANILTGNNSINSLASATTNYRLTNGVTQTLSGSRTGNTFHVDYVAATIDLGANGANTLTLNGLLGNTLTVTIQRTGGTGALVIGDSNELVVAPLSGIFNISAPVVDGAGAGVLTFNALGNGNLTLSGNNTYSGGTTMQGIQATPGVGTNTLYINSATALGTGPLTINSGRLDNSSVGAIALANNNAQIWNADVVFTGTRDLDMGTGAVSLGSSAGHNRTVTVAANTLTVGGVISDGTHVHLPTKALAKAGAGTLELTGASTFSGATTVSAGTLKLGASGSLASARIIVSSGATLQLAGSASLANTAALDASGLIQLGAGVKEQVGALSLGGVIQPDKTSYGSTASTATIRNDIYFSGPGILLVGVLPSSGTLLSFR